MSPAELNYLELSPAQHEFADREECEHRALRVGEDAVCLYRAAPFATIRWIVDKRGHVRDRTVLYYE